MRWTTPAFDAQYAALYGCALMPAFDAMLTIAAAAVEQVRERGLAHEERAGEVDADDALPVVERHLVRVREAADARRSSTTPAGRPRSLAALVIACCTDSGSETSTR